MGHQVPWKMGMLKGIAKGGVKNRNKGGCKRLFAFVCVCPRLLAFACVFASAFACVCQRLSAFVCVCSHLLTPPFVAPPSAWHWMLMYLPQLRDDSFLAPRRFFNCPPRNLASILVLQNSFWVQTSPLSVPVDFLSVAYDELEIDSESTENRLGIYWTSTQNWPEIDSEPRVWWEGLGVCGGVPQQKRNVSNPCDSLSFWILIYL